MRFKALCSTKDGRLTEGKVYEGTLVAVQYSLRVAIWDDKSQWMTFDPKVFVPA